MRSGSVVLLAALVIAAVAGGYVLLRDDSPETPVPVETAETVQQTLDQAAGSTSETESTPSPSAAADSGTTEAEAEEQAAASEPAAASQAASDDTAAEPERQATPTTETPSGEESQPARESGQAQLSEQDTDTAAVTSPAENATAPMASDGASESNDRVGTSDAPAERGGTEASAEAGGSEEAQQDTAEREQAGAEETVVAALPKAPLPDDEDDAAGERQQAPQAEPDTPPPSFDVVRIERDGGLVAAGRSPRGSRVFLLRDGKVEAEAEADRSGNWVLILDRPLPPGDHELLLEARLPSGETIRSSELVVASVPDRAAGDGARQAEAAGSGQEQSGEAPSSEGAVAIAVPQEGGGARVLQGQDAEENEGLRTLGLAILSVDYDAEGFIKVAGRGLPEATILAYLDNALIGRTTVAADEGWLIAPETAVEEGLYQLRIDQVNDAGEVVARLETVFARSVFIADLPLDRMVVVEPGNSLWRLARRLYGEGILYSVIYDANQDQIRDPDLIYPGQIFLAPRQLQAN